ncbi:tryptophan 7-halogenase [Salinicola sp. RZ23]|uniref:tryptophan 7-halogenase n=1 Tax=Salinicola sp. RZ23 TaxID=1949087 RepID=UPI000DA230F0|nr:tryptophan 7-halogenase [Salinicola sp. RZ23]
MSRSSAARLWDVVILGGGPAGSAAGLTLLQRDDLAIAMVEADHYDGPRIGESLSPGARPLLDYLGIWERFRATQPLASFGSLAAWGGETPQALDYLFTLHGNGWSLDRTGFDRLLAETFQERGGRLWQRTRLRAAQRLPSGEWQLQLHGEETSPRSLRTRFLIDATGRSGRLARHIGTVRCHEDRLVGVARIAQLPETAAIPSAIHVEACDDGWWYAAPLPERRLVVVAMSDADLIGERRLTDAQCWQQRLAAMPMIAPLTEGVRFTTPPRGFPAHTSRLVAPGGDGWVAVGDAATARDPLSSTGIPYALGSGIHGALVAVNALTHNADMLPSYARSLNDDYQQYLNSRWNIYRRETRWPDQRFWQRRRTRVELDPMTPLSDVAPATRLDATNPVHLTPGQARALLAHCRSGASSHQVVRDFAECHPELPDQRIILGLQELAEAGLVTLERAVAS